jgi:hypothetical protein
MVLLSFGEFPERTQAIAGTYIPVSRMHSNLVRSFLVKVADIPACLRLRGSGFNARS